MAKKERINAGDKKQSEDPDEKHGIFALNFIFNTIKTRHRVPRDLHKRLSRKRLLSFLECRSLLRLYSLS